MTRGELKTRVARKMSFNTDSASEEGDSLDKWANDAVRDVLDKTHCRVEIGTMALAVGIDSYRMDSSVLAVESKSITSQGGNYIFVLVPMQEIEDLKMGVAPAIGPPGRYAVQGNLLRVWPAPVMVDIINFVFVAMPTPMTTDAHDTSIEPYGAIPVFADRAVEYYMLWQASEQADKSAVLTTKDYFQLYTNECKLVRKTMRKMAGKTAAPARVGYPDRMAFPRRNDVYPQRY